MRVKVTYGIDLNDVPETAKTILESAKANIEKQLSLLKSIDALLGDNATVALVPRILQKASEEAILADASIKDALSLMTGFVKVLADEDAPAESDPPQSGPPNGED